MLGAWWVWLSAAVVLGIIEVMVPAFVFLGFAIGAAVVGVLLAVGVPMTAAWALVVFAVMSVVGYGVLRVALGKSRGDVRVVTKDVNEG